MSRVPGTFSRQPKVRVAFAPNPEWSDERREKALRGELTPACHDKTPHGDVHCPTCGYQQHIHLGQFAAIPAEVTEIGNVCPRCKTTMIFDRAETERALREAWGYE